MLRLRLFLLFMGMLFGPCRQANGQPYLQPSPVVAQLLGVNQGLSQGMINCIYQDKDGYMWICTKDGLNRYDGYKIVTYRHNASSPYSLSDNYCNAIIEDDNGNFWVATNTAGLMLFDKTTENFYPISSVNNKKENLCVRNLVYNKGRLFLTTMKNAWLLDISQVNIKNGPATIAKAGLLFDYNEQQSNSKYKLNYGTLPRGAVSWLLGNNIWIGFADSIFNFSQGNSPFVWKRTAFSPDGLGLEKSRKWVYSFFPMPGEPENMLISYKNKVIHYDTRNKKILYTKTLGEADTSSLTNLFVADGGNVCRITESNVYTYHPAIREAEAIAIKNLSLPEASIIQVYTNRQNIRWYGSTGFGTSIVDPRKQLFKSYTAIISEVYWNLPKAYMPTLAPSLRGIWPVALDKQKTYWQYMPQFKIDNNHLYACNTQKGNIKVLQGLPKGCLPIDIYSDYADGLWVYYRDASAKDNIAKIDKSTGALSASYSIPETIESAEPFISQFYFDEDGVMWLATINGLFALNEKNNTWRHWKNEPQNNNSISANGVLSICPDPISPKKYLWIGTEGAGMNRFEKSTGNCIRYDEKDGLPNNIAYCILSDSLNNLWISTNWGLSCFDPEKKTFQNFTKEDGLPGNEFNRYNAKRMQNGELMFGGVDGFVIFNPNSVLQKQPAAPLVFTGVSVLNKPVNWKTDQRNLNAPVGYANTLTLLPGQNIFSIGFATLEYRSNAKKMYKYKLDGFDNEWTNPSSRNEVTYTNLSPGTYTLEVMGTNTDGVWNEKPIRMKIIIQPYWYQTLVFKTCLFLFFALALYAFYRYRLMQALRVAKLRNRIARDLHDEIGSTLSSISIYAESAKRVATENKKANIILSKINDSTSEMMDAMSDIVWAVNSGNDDFDSLANRLRSFAVQVTEAKNIGLHFTDNKDIPAMVLDMQQRKNIYLICKEAINNAVKYADCTMLEVLISKEKSRLQILIRDNGKGFELVDGKATSSGNVLGGNGLKNMKDRADEIKAGLEINSNPGSGTTIMVTLL